jgi:ATP-dependent Lhr-like helicase
VREGGATLSAYPEFRKVVAGPDGRHVVPDPGIGRIHRASVGTIVADATMKVQVAGRGVLGTIDEGFIAALHPGENFVFAGERLELVAVRGLVAYARRATKRTTRTVHWPGARLPITGALGHALRRVLHEAGEGRRDTPELRATDGLIAEQAALSAVPREDTLLAEAYASEEGHHLFLFPFEGRRVHEGLGALVALRVGRLHPATFTIATDDHGLELLHPEPLPWADLLTPALFTGEGLVDDILASVHISELMRRRFREIARVAGFIHPGNPWELKSARQVQASASLLYDVFSRYDPENPLLDQARREVIEQHFDQARLGAALERLRGCRTLLHHPARFTPLAMPLHESMLSKNTATTESRAQRVERLVRRGR